ncbi:MAG TPA: cupredoxin domain-containing protein [Fimbriiglobus sp.]|nr:cupredoxin domain-containing protein [Fimbriiglobus sp.]
MRVRYVTTVLGLGAFALVCLAPESAQAQRRMGWGRGNAGYYPASPIYGNAWQPGYYGAPAAYGPGLSYATPMYQPQPNTYPSLQLSAETRSFTAPAYQQQPYGYQSPAAPCPPARPISPSALTSAPPQAMPSAASGAAQPAAATTVTANDNSFEPKTLNIRPGTTVTWTNRGEHAHTVTFDNGVDSADIAPGGSFSATFPHAGTYHYLCRHHEGMKGTVVVGEGGGSGASGPAN